MTGCIRHFESSQEPKRGRWILGSYPILTLSFALPPLFFEARNELRFFLKARLVFDFCFSFMPLRLLILEERILLGSSHFAGLGCANVRERIWELEG